MKNFETVIEMAANGEISNFLKITKEAGDYDHSITIIEFPFDDLSKEQIKAIKRTFNVREYIEHPFCGCEYDCCGCPCSESNELIRSESGNLTIKKILTFNY